MTVNSWRLWVSIFNGNRDLNLTNWGHGFWDIENYNKALKETQSDIWISMEDYNKCVEEANGNVADAILKALGMLPFDESYYEKGEDLLS